MSVQDEVLKLKNDKHVIKSHLFIANTVRNVNYGLTVFDMDMMAMGKLQLNRKETVK